MPINDALPFNDSPMTYASRKAIDPNRFAFIMNPTDNPVGGGPGYNTYWNASGKWVNGVLQGSTTPDHTPTTTAELVTALSTATTGEIIFIDGDLELDLSTVDQATIGTGAVTLVSNRSEPNINGRSARGALLYSNTQYTSTGSPFEDDHVLGTNGTGVVIAGLRLQGPEGDNESSTASGNVGKNFAFIRAFHVNMEVENCEVYNCKKWGIELSTEDNAEHHIHHCFFHHTRMTGFGYPIWCRGKVPDVTTPDDVTVIEANIFFESRHCVGAGGQDGCSYIAQYNGVLNHSMTSNHQFDMHDDGQYALIQWNIAYKKCNYLYHGPEFAPSESVTVQNNYTEYRDLLDMSHSSVRALADTTFQNNVYGLSFRGVLPTLTLTSDKTECLIGETVTFTATGTDHDGLIISRYLWCWDIDKSMDLSDQSTFTKSWSDSGIYTVYCYAGNDAGIFSRAPRAVSIWVKKNASEPANKAWMSEWWEFTEDGTDDRVGSHRGIPMTPGGSVSSGTDANGTHMLFTSNSSSAPTAFVRSQNLLHMENFNIAEDDITIYLKFMLDVQEGSSNVGLIGHKTGALGADLIEIFINSAGRISVNNEGTASTISTGTLYYAVFKIPRVGNGQLIMNGVDWPLTNGNVNGLIRTKAEQDQCDTGSRNTWDIPYLWNSGSNTFRGKIYQHVFFKRATTSEEDSIWYNGGDGVTYEEW